MKPTCVYCKGTHTPNHCNVIVDVGQRLEHVKKEGLCFNCLGKHRVSQCTSQVCCKKCNSKHHTSICNPDNAKTKHTTPATSPTSHKTYLVEQNLFLVRRPGLQIQFQQQ